MAYTFGSVDFALHMEKDSNPLVFLMCSGMRNHVYELRY